MNIPIIPFEKSKAKTSIEILVPRNLKAFVNPAFLLPLVLISIFLNNFPKIIEELKFPIRYAMTKISR